MLYLSVLFESRDSITLIFLSRYNRDGCQFNMSTNVCFFLFSLVSQSGCKTKTSFCFLQEKFKVFFENFLIPISLFFLPVFQGTFRVLRGANVKSIFKSHKLFWIFFFNFFQSFDSSACQYFSERLSLLRVQKYHLYLHLQAFILHFFHVF